MRITFLGTGTSQGIPVIGCDCKACKSKDSKDKRLRSSVLVETENYEIVIDPGPDFRQQMLRVKQKSLDAILVTHPHKDHIGGMDDVRAFNYLQKKPMDIYIKESFVDDLKREFFYAFGDKKYPGVPDFNVIPVTEEFYINEEKMIPINVMHHKMPIFGFRIGAFTYITDASFISDSEAMKVIGSKVLVINGIREKEHFAHFNINQAVDFIKKVNPQYAYITHISHMLGPQMKIKSNLPSNINLAYDGLSLSI